MEFIEVVDTFQVIIKVSLDEEVVTVDLV